MTDIEVPDVDKEGQNEMDFRLENIKKNDPGLFGQCQEKKCYQPIEEFLSREVNCLMDEISKFVMFQPVYERSKTNNIHTNVQVCPQATFHPGAKYMKIHYHLKYDTDSYQTWETFQGNDGSESREVQVSATYNNPDTCEIYTVMGMDDENAVNHSNFNTYKVSFVPDTYICCSRDQLEELYRNVIEDTKKLYDHEDLWDLFCSKCGVDWDIYDQREIPLWILAFTTIPGVCYIHYFLGAPINLFLMFRKLLHVMNIHKYMDLIGPIIETPQIQIIQYFHTKFTIPWVWTYQQKFYEFCFLLLSLYLLTFHTYLYWHFPKPSIFYLQIMLLISLLVPGVNVLFRWKKYKEGEDLLMGGEKWYIENEFSQDQNKKTLTCDDV
jgi:hypothetical protein